MAKLNYLSFCIDEVESMASIPVILVSPDAKN
jgi:hypothetical protein